MTTISGAFPPSAASAGSSKGLSGRTADTATRPRARTREIVALTDSDGKRASARRRMDQYREAMTSGSGPVDGWAFTAESWAEIKLFALRSGGCEAEVWSVIADELDRLADVLVDRFGDVRGWRRDRGV